MWVDKYEYYYDNGNLCYDWKYNEDGKRTGTQKYYYENGNMRFEGNWENGAKHGKFREYSETGELVSVTSFVDDQLQASLVIEDNKKTENSYQPELIIGKYKYQPFSENFHGTGYFKLYNNMNMIIKEGYFKNGKLIQGRHYTYDTNNSLYSITIYKNGRIITRAY